VTAPETTGTAEQRTVLAFVVSVNVMVPTGAMFCANGQDSGGVAVEITVARVNTAVAPDPVCAMPPGLATVIDVVPVLAVTVKAPLS